MRSVSAHRQPGVFVLGMHRSGTSVVAGVLAELGVDGGPTETMFPADRFNSDGYWEQIPVVELHDRLLRGLGGFASAPPDDTANIDPELLAEATDEIDEFVSGFDRPWFVKDPRQCLLLDVWERTLGRDDLVVLVSRDPDAVVRSLRHRNGYPRDLAAGLWERYTAAVLRAVDGRRCHIVQYEKLLDDPDTVVAELSETIATVTFGIERQAGIDPDVLAQARALVRPANRASSAPPTEDDAACHPEQRVLYDMIRDLSGRHERFVAPVLPDPSASGRRAIRRRRHLLRAARVVVGDGAERRATLDRRRRRSLLRQRTRGHVR